MSVSAIGVLNGAIGDYLHRTGNGLATPMQLVRGGRVLDLDAASLARALPSASARVIVSVHGRRCTESVWEFDDRSTYGSRLERDVGATAIDVRYNSGIHISENGAALDACLTALVAAYPRPIERIDLVGHSMGGLVVRSATHVAATRPAGDPSPWLAHAKNAFYLGTPHLGAPLERFGNALTWALRKIARAAGEPVTELVADILALRSSGVKDLRYGSLRHEDWVGHDADALLENRCHPVPLLPSLQHHLIAASLSDEPIVAMLVGDALVPVPSARGNDGARDHRPPFDRAHVRVMPGKHHLAIAHDEEVYEQLRAWYEAS